MKRNCKLISKIICVIFLLLVVFCMSATAIYDENKIIASRIAEKLFSSEKNYIDQAYHAYDLKNLEDENEFILINGSQKGYVIFTSENFDVVEYSFDGISPYKDVNKNNSYYGGPGNYFIKKGERINNILTKEEINIEECKVINNKLKSKRSKNKANENIATTKSVKENIELKNSLFSNVYSTDPGPSGTGENNSGYVDINRYSIVSQKYIPNYRYFLLEPKHGENNNSECVVVATQLLLGYHNWANDGRLIPDQYLLGTEQDRCLPYNQSVLGTDDTFFDLLKSYMFNTDNGVWLGTATAAIGWYMDDYVAANVSSHVSKLYHIINVKNTIKNSIDNGNPVVVGMNIYTGSNENLDKDKHAVVVYGYQTIKINGNNVEGFIAHYGWENVYNVWFDADWVIDCMTFSSSHRHENEIPIAINNYNNHITQCNECRRYKANDLHIIQNYRQKETNLNGNRVDEKYHYAVCYCGYIRQEYHSFNYIDSNNTNHKKVCNSCSFMQYESHFYKLEDECFYCCHER